MAQINRSPSYESSITLGDEIHDRDKQSRPEPLQLLEQTVTPAETERHNRNSGPRSEMVAPAEPPPSRFHLKWLTTITFFTPNRRTDDTNAGAQRRKMPRSVKTYYRSQKKDIEALSEAKRLSTFSDLAGPLEEVDSDGEERKLKKKRYVKCKCSCIQLSVEAAARLTLSMNVLLLFFKLIATVQSGSLSVLSSLIDSVLDLFSGITIAISSYLIRRYDPYHYPIGRNRLEPVAIIITASVMGTATLQIITTAIEHLAEGSADPNINVFSGYMIVVTVIIKGGLYMVCRQVKNPSVKALAVDHRNDFVSNIAALIFGIIGTFVYKNIDPIGAILLAIYIIVNWVGVGYEQLKNLVGHTADRRFLSKLTWIAANHDRAIVTVDTVRAYTFGVNYLVEVHVQMEPDMPLRQAHDIGESLQQKLESLAEVERAFVHLDYETLHSPSIEHKLP